MLVSMKSFCSRGRERGAGCFWRAVCFGHFSAGLPLFHTMGVTLLVITQDNKAKAKSKSKSKSKFVLKSLPFDFGSGMGVRGHDGKRRFWDPVHDLHNLGGKQVYWRCEEAKLAILAHRRAALDSAKRRVDYFADSLRGKPTSRWEDTLCMGDLEACGELLCFFIVFLQPMALKHWDDVFRVDVDSLMEVACPELPEDDAEGEDDEMSDKGDDDKKGGSEKDKETKTPSYWDRRKEAIRLDHDKLSTLLNISIEEVSELMKDELHASNVDDAYPFGMPPLSSSSSSSSDKPTESESETQAPEDTAVPPTPSTGHADADASASATEAPASDLASEDQPPSSPSKKRKIFGVSD